MVTKKLRPAFIVTGTLATACASEPQVPITESWEGLRPRQGSASTAEQTEPAPPPEDGSVSLHPKDADGRTIFVTDDNHCHVEIPRTDKPPPRTDGWVHRSYVDCPTIFDDPAWDARRSNMELRQDKKTGQCFFEPVYGNPPPPSIRAQGPATTSTPATDPSASPGTEVPEPTSSSSGGS